MGIELLEDEGKTQTVQLKPICDCVAKRVTPERTAS